jgi:hypothetical protein
VVSRDAKFPTTGELKHLGYWWKQHKNQPLEEITNQTTLGQAVSDLGILALGYLARRLTDERTPEAVRDRIALSFGPRMLINLHKGMPAEGTRDEGDGLLADYHPPETGS